ncbi:glycoside hydrolase [Cyanobacterium aponinum AL20118]|uniref:Glycoside hydrolase n=1 Tax=Cyanobacterium aponinum AL20115 TaxID=3090662 RepID=A0AAF0ZCJ6_9CHRO|nr:glycoside hydrolase [Cyanobacterium aponinum]WPF87793.1 glycoside hydrolase [Cyanobacterium aponinum AL20115]
MSHPLYVAFIWHQHQPLYKSRLSNHDFGGQYRLPWVRLHGTKDYLDLMLILEKYPKLHQTVNLVPSLMLQLEDYAKGDVLDPYLALSLTAVSQLTIQQKEFIINHFFDANHYHMIRPHRRYDELYQERHDLGTKWCLKNWQDNDYADVLAWHNLAWIDPVFWDDPEIAGWLRKGKRFNLEDRRNIWKKQREIISRIIPQHKKMQDAGQLEVTTTPYTHPILPLLADTNAGQVAVPKMRLPSVRFQWEEDIPRHLDKALAMYQERFGRSPRGLWPSEQSVSPTILPHVAKRGFDWLCSDEGVLGISIEHYFYRDETGNVYDPDRLYRPYRLETENGDLSIVFRDHRLSDLIGFSYGSMTADNAAKDLIGHLEAISRRLKSKQEEDQTSLEQPWLVTIALDGENCWEFYEQDGKIFLETLYERLSGQEDIQLVTVSEFIDKFPPTEVIKRDRLHTGSWIDANFTTWIGDPDKNKAWEYLQAARETLAKHPEATETTNPEAWEALYAAEGSDWFWWFGDPHHSSHDDMFDQLFREHLIALYQALKEPVPEYLYKPVAEPRKQEEDYIPGSFIHPPIDGQGEDEDWERAGKIIIGGSRGTMHRSSVIPRIFYGWNHLSFYLRFDLKQGINSGKDLPSELHLAWYFADVVGSNNGLPLADVPDKDPVNHYFRYHLGIHIPSQTCWLEEAGGDFKWHSRHCEVRIALERALEIAFPWKNLHVDPDQKIYLVAVLADNGKFKEALTQEHPICIQVP